MGADFLDVSDPLFLHQLCYSLTRASSKQGVFAFLDLEEEAFFSLFFDLSLIQDSSRFRALRRARLLATALIDEKGDLDKNHLHLLTDLLEKEGFVFYANGLSDRSLIEHELTILRRLHDDKIGKLLRKFQFPLCHLFAEDLIRQTLGITQKKLNDAHIRKAVLAACLTPLRQNVGSCFATAPAILIQKEQLEIFLEDLLQLLATGKLKRTFNGVEYALPLSPSTGIGDLRKQLNISDDKAKVSLSPGLIAACEAAGLISEDLPWEKKAEKLEQLLKPYLEKKSSMTVEMFLHELLLDQHHLLKEDLQAFSLWEKAQLKNRKMSTFLPDKASSKKMELIQKMTLKETLARAAFKGVCDNALLKAWEFTLASYSEVKMEFTNWNLYTSLGLNHQESGGIGSIIYQHLEKKLDIANEKIKAYQKEYEIAFDQLRATEILLKQASSEAEIRRLQAEYRSRGYHLQSCLEMRDAYYAQGTQYSTLYSFLIQQYTEQFPIYFQEIYDAEMLDLKEDLYDDSPAGFRLVYKHGRSDPSLWTLIYDGEQYLDALVDFFTATELLIQAACEWEDLKQDVLEITSAIVHHLRAPLFLETAFERLRNQTSLTHLSQERKPWAYISGGTMTTLLKTYYRKTAEISAETKWVESESELLIFLIDVLKHAPLTVAEAFLKNPEKGMLASSPSHAFILQPGSCFFKEGWQETGFTYTWVRDHVFLPGQKFYSQMKLTSSEQLFLFDSFCRQLPLSLEHLLQNRLVIEQIPVSVDKWRKSVLDLLKETVASAQLLADGLDAFLYQSLPLVSGKEFRVLIRRLLSDKMDQKIEKALLSFSDQSNRILSAKTVRDAAKGLYLMAYPHLTLSFDLHQYIADHSRYIGLSQPTPFLFADTNWTNAYFGFVVNPGNGRLELWRLDRTASEGMPMSLWKHWLNGTDQKEWAVYHKPFEYGG